MVVGNKEKIKANAFDAKNVQNLSVKDLAQGGLGRIVVYTEDAIKDLQHKFEGEKK